MRSYTVPLSIGSGVFFMQKICGIYMIKNKANNKVYIGQSVNIISRWANHKSSLRHGVHSNTHLQRAWDKYGEANFEFSILEECDIDSLSQKEIMYISSYKSNDANYGYNLTLGGEGTTGMCEESKDKFRASFKRNMDEHPEYLQRQRENAIKQFQDPDFYTQYRAFRSTDEFREKERLSHLGICMSDETKRKISETLGKPILCVETGVVYPSARAANRALPGNVTVQSAALGIRKTAGGYHWKYVDTV